MVELRQNFLCMSLNNMKTKGFKSKECIARLCFRALLLWLPVIAQRSNAHCPVSTWISPVRINSLVGLLKYAEDTGIRSLSDFQLPSFINVNVNRNRMLWTTNNDNKDSSTNTTQEYDNDLLLVTLRFSLWRPALYGNELTESDEQDEYFLLAVLAVLRDFFCQHISHMAVVHPANHSHSLCSSIGNVTDDLAMFAYVNETIHVSTGYDILLTFGTMIISQQKEGDVDWMSWEVTYQVVEAGSLATPMQIHEEFTLQATIQSVLERTIQRGTLNKKLREYMGSSRPTFGLVGQEVEAFQESVMALLDQYDFSADAYLLQQIGIAILILVTCTYITLTGAARNHRLLRERQRILERQRRQCYRDEVRRSSIRKSVEHHIILPEVVLLETEEDVNLMLAVGREASLKALNLSRGLQASSCQGK